jgi:hypothetical protein
MQPSEFDALETSDVAWWVSVANAVVKPAKG